MLRPALLLRRAAAPAAARVAAPLAPAARYTPARSVRSVSSSTTPKRACPACGAAIPIPASPCPSCAALVAIPQGLSLHSLLDVSEPVPGQPGAEAWDIPAELATLPAHGYDLHARDLRNRMLKRQAALHPDRHNGADLAATLSARVNKAYETLADPLRRSEYILKQYGKDVKEQEGVQDHDLLMEILEARETLEEASDAEEIEEIRDENHAKVVALVKRITATFSQDPPDVDEAKALTVELKYWIGLENAAREKL